MLIKQFELEWAGGGRVAALHAVHIYGKIIQCDLCVYC